MENRPRIHHPGVRAINCVYLNSALRKVIPVNLRPLSNFERTCRFDTDDPAAEYARIVGVNKLQAVARNLRQLRALRIRQLGQTGTCSSANGIFDQITGIPRELTIGHFSFNCRTGIE